MTSFCIWDNLRSVLNSQYLGHSGSVLNSQYLGHSGSVVNSQYLGQFGVRNKLQLSCDLEYPSITDVIVSSWWDFLSANTCFLKNELLPLKCPRSMVSIGAPKAGEGVVRPLRAPCWYTSGYCFGMHGYHWSGGPPGGGAGPSWLIKTGARRSYGAQGASYKICVRTPARFLPRPCVRGTRPA